MYRVLGVVVVSVFALAGCSGSPVPTISHAYDPNDPQTWPFEDLVNQAIAGAEAAGATSDQLDILNAARASGSVTPAQMHDATQAVVACIADLGAVPSAITETTSLGLTQPTFTYVPPPNMTSETFDPLYSECDAKNSRYVDEVFQGQPAAREALSKTLSDHEAQLKQCLIDMGGGAETQDFTINELWEALKDQSFGGEDYGYSREKDCIIDAGINW